MGTKEHVEYKCPTNGLLFSHQARKLRLVGLQAIQRFVTRKSLCWLSIGKARRLGGVTFSLPANAGDHVKPHVQDAVMTFENRFNTDSCITIPCNRYSSLYPLLLLAGDCDRQSSSRRP